MVQVYAIEGKVTPDGKGIISRGRAHIVQRDTLMRLYSLCGVSHYKPTAKVIEVKDEEFNPDAPVMCPGCGRKWHKSRTKLEANP